MDLSQARWTCLLVICHLAATHASGDRAPVMPMACSQVVASMGSFYRWPTSNPGMVAPVDLVWNYPVYKNPLQCSFTGKSIAIDIPGSYGDTAGFHLGTSSVPTKTDERYRLVRAELRKPAAAYSGLGQALSHVMEMVLVHREENGNRFANVILPFQVSTNGADFDIINPIIDGVKLPSRISQTGIVMASSNSQMFLDPAFQNATFSEFWGTTEAAGCKSKTVDVRYFMRTNTLSIGIDSFAQMSNALENAAEQQPVQPPAATWIVGSCKNGTGKCSLKKAEDMQAKLASLQKYQSQAVAEQRSRKADLDSKLKTVKNHTGPATNASIAAYNAAAAAYNDLKGAASELISSQAHVASVQAFATEASSSKWDQNAPKSNQAPALVQNTPAQLQSATTALMDIGTDQESGDCSALGQSPVDIDTKRVVDSAALPSDLLQPLAFRYMSLVEDGRQGALVQLSHRGRHLRVAVPPGSIKWPLGGMLSGGVLRGVSYVDIHMPGQHAVDGHVPAVELQLVHESVPGKPAMAVAVPLELRGSSSTTIMGGDPANEWLTPLLEALPTQNAPAKEVLGQPLGLLHKSLSSGATTDYYRYDGSLTKPPCLRTEWFVLGEPGQLSHQQFSELSTALGVDAAKPAQGPKFMTSLVMKGAPRLVSQVADRSSASLLSSKFRGRRRLQV